MSKKTMKSLLARFKTKRRQQHCYPPKPTSTPADRAAYVRMFCRLNNLKSDE